MYAWCENIEQGYKIKTQRWYQRNDANEVLEDGATALGSISQLRLELPAKSFRLRVKVIAQFFLDLSRVHAT